MSQNQVDSRKRDDMPWGAGDLALKKLVLGKRKRVSARAVTDDRTREKGRSQDGTEQRRRIPWGRFEPGRRLVSEGRERAASSNLST